MYRVQKANFTTRDFLRWEDVAEYDKYPEAENHARTLGYSRDGLSTRVVRATGDDSVAWKNY